MTPELASSKATPCSRSSKRSLNIDPDTPESDRKRSQSFREVARENKRISGIKQLVLSDKEGKEIDAKDKPSAVEKLMSARPKRNTTPVPKKNRRPRKSSARVSVNDASQPTIIDALENVGKVKVASSDPGVALLNIKGNDDDDKSPVKGPGQ